MKKLKLRKPKHQRGLFDSIMDGSITSKPGYLPYGRTTSSVSPGRLPFNGKRR